MAKQRPHTEEPPRDWQPTEAVPDPILNSPYDVPQKHWIYRDGRPFEFLGRRPASHWFKSKKIGADTKGLFAEEERDDLDLVNLLRKDVERWRNSKPSAYEGATGFTKELLAWWTRPDSRRRLFFCQVEAIETLIYLLEIALSVADGVRPALRWKPEVDPDTLRQLLRSEKPAFATDAEYYPRLVDTAGDPALLLLRRVGCKMATGAGKTAVMAMLITWAFVNRGRNPATARYPNAVLVCAPNLTVRKRLAVLYPENPDNIYDQFDLVPPKYRELLNAGKVLVTNWHYLALKSEHREGDTSYRDDYLGYTHRYEPDFVVRLRGGSWLVLEIKGVGGKIYGDDPDRVEAKNAAARKWVVAINNTGRYGHWTYEICEETSRLRSLLVKLAGAATSLPFRIERRPLPEERYRECLPLVGLRGLVRRFSEPQMSFDDQFDWAGEWAMVSLPFELGWGMFVAHPRSRVRAGDPERELRRLPAVPRREPWPKVRGRSRHVTPGPASGGVAHRHPRPADWRELDVPGVRERAREGP